MKMYEIRIPNPSRFLSQCLIAALFLGGSMMQAADLKVNRNYGDNMVLQRDQPVTIAGTADEGTTVTVSMAGQRKTATTGENGGWRVKLDPMPANTTPQTLKAAAGSESVTVKNILVGDVFLVAQQTSIDITLGRDDAGKKAAAALKEDPLFRAISIKTIPSRSPQTDLAADATAGWRTVDQPAALDLSGTAFYLGRDLAAQQEIPIGLININLGSAFPTAWLSREALLETENLYGRSDIPGNITRMENLADLAAKGEPKPRKEVISSDPLKYALYPAGCYNAVLHPLKGLTLKAALVQLGNNYPYMIYAELEEQGTHVDRQALNRAYVETYNIRKVGFRMDPVTTPRIPREWREYFEAEALPFGWITPPGSALKTLGEHGREMRELQRLTAGRLPGVSIILPGSANIPFSAQPNDARKLAAHCLAWVEGTVYEAEPPATGPMFEGIDANLNKATISFKAGTAEGLRDTGDGLERIEVAGLEGNYVPAEADIDGNVIRVTSRAIPRIVHVRYDWSGTPTQGLVNEAGLPAMPFRSEKKPYHWFVRNKESDLPEEYSTPANEWKGGDVTLVNGQLKTHGYHNFTGWIGPVGVKTGPFGPNMGVREVAAGSPADGKLFVGDVIYSANGNMLGEKAWEVMGAAVTESETRKKGGALTLGVRRSGKNIDVAITLDVMGSYSPTAPYDCPKTEKIIADLKQWLLSQGAGAGFLNTDAIFMLATGDPEMQGYVRRIVYNIMAGMDPDARIDPTQGMKSWHTSANAFLLGEYYLATGDRTVLPYLRWFCHRLALTQNPEGGWRHNFPGGPHYGLIPNAGLPGVMGMHFAKQAGVKILESSYRRGLKHFGHNRAETGFLIYGFGGCSREIPAPIDPEALANGKLNTYNGGLSAAGLLMGLAGKPRAAHLCSLISAYSWNNTFGGHGGNFWNNFWSPLGAHAHSRDAFINFWKNYRWYRECNRMFDGSLIQHATKKVGAGVGVALVAPRQRIQVVGAPSSPFAVDAPDSLEEALNAYRQRDYAKCESMVTALLDSGTVGMSDRPTVEYLARAASDMQTSIASDLARMKQLAAKGDPEEARSFLPGLIGVIDADDARLKTIQETLASAKQAKKGNDEPKTSKKQEAEETPRTWVSLTTEIATDKRQKDTLGKVPPAEATPWRLTVVEDMSQAPDNWTGRTFDDSDWTETTLPISWRMYHTALLRAEFNVEDKKAFDGLRFRGWFFRQQGMEIYLNGELIGKVNNLEKKTGNVEGAFKEAALRKLRNGKNLLAITTRHNWRWGMLFMKVYNDGYGFRLDASLKQDD